MSTLKTVALVFGIVYLLIGLLGFVLVPGGGQLLGIFQVDTTHNMVHILIGIFGIAAAFTNYSRLYCQVFAVIFLLLAVVGFLLVPDTGALFNLISLNVPDHLLHLVSGLILGYFGFVYRGAEEPRRAGMA